VRKSFRDIIELASARTEMSRRQILIAALGLVIGTAVTVAATFFVIERLVTVKDDPMDRAGGMKPSQKAK
jgi:hypothetical protein